MSDELHPLETPPGLYTLTRAHAAMAALESFIETHDLKDGLGSFALHVAAMRELLDEEIDSLSTHDEREQLADRLDQEANVILTHLGDYPIPPAAHATTNGIRILYARAHLPFEKRQPDALAAEVGSHQAVIEAAIREQAPHLTAVECAKLARECLAEDYRQGFCPVAPPAARETAAE